MSKLTICYIGGQLSSFYAQKVAVYRPILVLSWTMSQMCTKHMIYEHDITKNKGQLMLVCVSELPSCENMFVAPVSSFSSLSNMQTHVVEHFII